MSEALQIALTVLSVIATALLALVAAMLSGLRKDIKDNTTDLNDHKNDTVAHRTQNEIDLERKAADVIWGDVRDRLRRIEEKLDKEK